MIPNLYKTIAAAMRNGRRIVIRYNRGSGSRVVEPHALFKSDSGEIGLLGYQVRGYRSSKRNGSYWRAFRLGKIDNIHVGQELFEPRVGHGYAAVMSGLKGEVLAALEPGAREYCFFDDRVQGPAMPAYLAPTPHLMLRMARESNRQGHA